MRKSVKSIFVCAAVLAGVFIILPQLQLTDRAKGVVNADDSADGDNGIQALVINTGSNERELNFTWYDSIGEEGTVYMAEKVTETDKLDEDGFPLDVQYIAYADGEPVQYTDGNSKYYKGCYINKATISGIEPGKEYVYRVGNGDTYSDIYDFELKGNLNDWSFYYSGDPQLNNSHSSSSTIVTQWISTINKITELNPDTSLLVTGGDLADAGGGQEAQYINGFLAPERLKNLTVATSVGNHDQFTSGIPYTEHFNQPNQTDIGSFNGTAGDYWYTYNNALFIHLTTSTTNDIDVALSYVDEHEQFIKDAIEANPDTDWHILVYHEALLSAATHSTASYTRQMREVFIPILDEIDQEYGIDLVLNAHDHYYSRTYLMQGLNALSEDNVESEVTDPDGIYYITANTGSGIKYYEGKNIDYNYLAFKEQQYTPNISNVEIDTDPYKTSLHITTYRTAEGNKYTGTEESMSVVDEFTINKTAQNQISGDSIRIIDSDTGVNMVIPNIFSQEETKLCVTSVTSGEDYTKLDTALKNDAAFAGYNIVSSFIDVKAKWCGENLKLNDETELFIPLPDNKGYSPYGNGEVLYKVYSVSESGNVTAENVQLTAYNGVKGVKLKTKQTGIYALGVAVSKKNIQNIVINNTDNDIRTVVKNIPVKKLFVSKKQITLRVKDKYQIKVNIKPANASNKKLKYKSSNKKVAKVTKKGKITAVKKGKAVIKVSAADGSGKTLKIKVKVKPINK